MRARIAQTGGSNAPAGILCTASRSFAPRMFSLVALFTCVALAARSQTRGLSADEPPAQSNLTNGKYYALVIGINDYKPPLARLKTAVNDARSVGNLLQQRFGFEVTYLLDQQATRFN